MTKMRTKIPQNVMNQNFLEIETNESQMWDMFDLFSGYYISHIGPVPHSHYIQYFHPRDFCHQYPHLEAIIILLLLLLFF